jgi:hypothetical protein
VRPAQIPRLISFSQEILSKSSRSDSLNEIKSQRDADFRGAFCVLTSFLVCDIIFLINFNFFLQKVKYFERFGEFIYDNVVEFLSQKGELYV